MRACAPNYSCWNRPQKTKLNNNTWDIWVDFCIQLHCSTRLFQVEDPIPLLQILHNVTALESSLPAGIQHSLEWWKKPIKPWARHSTHWDTPAPALSDQEYLTSASLDHCQPTPIPLPIMGQAANFCRLANMACSNAMADMFILGFFFLLCPGEYAYTPNPNATPCRLCDVHILINN
jgi:hypothetical protein